MTSTRRFPWFWMSFFLLAAIAGLITYDVTRVGGNFKKSATAKLLDDLGLLEYSQQAWQKSLSASARGYLWMETNAPIYYDRTVEVCKPYSQLSKDAVTIAVTKLCLVYTNVKDYIIEKTPIVIATIDEYAPGLIDKVGGYASSGYDFVKKYSLEYYQVAVDYLGTKVFVGEWAPEILQNKTQSALNVAKNQVSTYFHWFREQVYVYSKIP